MAETVSSVAERLSREFGSTWQAGAGLAYGTPDAAVTGIAVTWTPTLDVLRRAVEKQQNLIVSLEPPFWNGKAPEGRSPGQAELEPDATYQAKSAFMAAHGINVLYVRSGWTAMAEDGQLRGLARALDWNGYYQPRADLPAWTTHNNLFVLPTTDFGTLAQQIKSSLNADTIRCVGKQQTSVTRVALTHGYLLVPDLERFLDEQDFDVLVCGEACEWEAVPYFMDLIASGQDKGMILLGSQVSSEPGCGELASWLRGLIQDVTVEWHPAGEPFRTVS